MDTAVYKRLLALKTIENDFACRILDPSNIFLFKTKTNIVMGEGVLIGWGRGTYHLKCQSNLKSCERTNKSQICLEESKMVDNSSIWIIANMLGPASQIESFYLPRTSTQPQGRVKVYRVPGPEPSTKNRGRGLFSKKKGGRRLFFEKNQGAKTFFYYKI